MTIGRVALAFALATALSGCAILLPQSEAFRAQWPATLGDRAELTAVPFFTQKDYECGPAALAMLLAFDAVPVTPEELVPKVYVPGRKGSLQIEMLAAPRAYGVVSWQLGPRLEDVLREVEAGTPVIVLQDYGVWPLPVWHYAVVIGYDRASSKVVLRSGEKERLEIPLPVLEYTWKPSRYWAIVAIPPDRIAATATEGAWSAAVAAMERVSSRAAARTAYRTLLARWPDSLNGAIGLANVHYADAEFGAAEQVLRGVLAQHPESAVALNNLAQVLSDEGRNAEALQVIEEAIARAGPFQKEAEQTRAQIRAKMDAARR